MVRDAARGGHRGHPRRRLQPHRRGQPPRARRCRSAASTTRRTTAWSTTTRRTTTTHGHRQHAAHAQPARAAADHGLAALLGHRDARRRLPLRPRRDARPRVPRGRPAERVLRPRPAGPGRLAGQADRRAVGRRRGRLPGRQLPAAVDRVERQVPRHRARLLARRAGLARRVRLPPHRLERPLRGRRPRARSRRSTSSPRTTASRCATSSPTTRSTTRPTARTTATARATTARGTAASRGRPTTRRSTRCASGSSATSSPRCCSRRACRCCCTATSSAAPRAATTTPTARTTRSRGSTGRRDRRRDLLEFTRGCRAAAPRASGVPPAPLLHRRRRPRDGGLPRHRLVHARRRADGRGRLGRPAARSSLGGLPQRRRHPRARTRAAQPITRRLVPAALQRPRRDDATSRCPTARTATRVGRRARHRAMPVVARPAEREGRSAPAPTRSRWSLRAVVVLPRTPERRGVPDASTYRLQLHAGFGFADAAAVVPYLAELGVSHLYLSPPAGRARLDARLRRRRPHAGSTTSSAARDGLARARARRAHAHGLGDRRRHRAEPHGDRRRPSSSTARCWDGAARRPRLAVRRTGSTSTGTGDGAHRCCCRCSAARSTRCSPTGELDASASTRASRCCATSTTRFPLAPGTERRCRWPSCSTAQHYRLAYWRVGDERARTTGASSTSTRWSRSAVEDPEVFDATHARAARAASRDGAHRRPADRPPRRPRRPARLPRAAARGDRRRWVVVEKILEPGEQLPPTGRAHGTTGYDALRAIGGAVRRPGRRPALDGALRELDRLASRGSSASSSEAKREVAAHDLFDAEVARLAARAAVAADGATALEPDAAARGARASCSSPFRSTARTSARATRPTPTSRAPGRRRGAARATRGPTSATTLDVARALLLGVSRRARRGRDLVVRFQQVCGPVMAKGVEDTAFYRWHRAASRSTRSAATRARFGASAVEQLPRVGRAQQAAGRSTLTTLSTHDTKRSEDVRARLARARRGSRRRGRAWRGRRGGRPRRPRRTSRRRTCSADAGRGLAASSRSGSCAYLEKAAREAKQSQRVDRPDEPYERRVRDFAAVLPRAGDVARRSARVARRTRPRPRGQSLAPKLLQLTMPGVPDVYQGTELVGPVAGRPRQPAAGRLRACGADAR